MPYRYFKSGQYEICHEISDNEDDPGVFEIIRYTNDDLVVVQTDIHTIAEAERALAEWQRRAKKEH
jgi:hypothetical protein